MDIDFKNEKLLHSLFKASKNIEITSIDIDKMKARLAIAESKWEMEHLNSTSDEFMNRRYVI